MVFAVFSFPQMVSRHLLKVHQCVGANVVSWTPLLFVGQLFDPS